MAELLESLRGNPSRVRLEAFVQEAAASVPDGARVLDAGAGEGMYRPLFAGRDYEAADFQTVEKSYGEVDYVCDLRSIPVEADRYQLVLCSQVLEHLPEPAVVLAELHRVLAPGGRLWLSAPLFYAEHEQPYDFFRYTQFGLRHLLETAGFGVERIEPLEGYFGTLCYQARAATELPVSASAYGGGVEGRLIATTARCLRPAVRKAGDLFAHLEQRHKLTDVGLPKNYSAVAVKP